MDVISQKKILQAKKCVQKVQFNFKYGLKKVFKWLTESKVEICSNEMFKQKAWVFLGYTEDACLWEN